MERLRKILSVLAVTSLALSGLLPAQQQDKSGSAEWRKVADQFMADLVANRVDDALELFEPAAVNAAGGKQKAKGAIEQLFGYCGRPLEAGLLCSGCLAQTVQPQSPEQSPFAAPSRDGGVREVLESIVIPPIPNAPFTATLDTEWDRYTAEGATITLANERHIARDRKGRVYQERWYLVPKNGKAKSEMNWIQIADPKQRTLYNCSPERHICELRNYEPGGELPAAAKPMPIPGGVLKTGYTTVEDLGTRNIAGVETVGLRETTLIEPGVEGNDRAVTAMHETWHSQELGINLLSIRSEPIVGKQTFTITELSAADPDAHLFQVPDGYTVIDLRTSSRKNDRP